MERYKIVENKVEELYTNGHVSEEWDVWIRWSYPNHVSVVAKNAERLAKQFGGNVDHAVAGALLHDVADVNMERSDPGHEEECERIAEEVLKDAEFSDEEITTIIRDVIAPHSCREIMPEILEGKILATADAMAHISTDFYFVFAWYHWGNKSDLKNYEEFRIWVLERMEKDFHRKIFFPEIAEEIKPFYETIKTMLVKKE